jgi:hypothetical protein
MSYILFESCPETSGFTFKILITFAKPHTPVLRKFFPLDKNYVLEKAQLSLENTLLDYLVDYVKVQYMLQYNSLGLVDETVQRIENHQSADFSRLHELYITLMGIFRFQYYHDNQLEFSFDGREPFDRYCDEWQTAFKKWAKELCRQKNFLWGVLELTVFYPQEAEAKFIGERINVLIAQFFEVRIHPQKGITRKIA